MNIQSNLRFISNEDDEKKNKKRKIENNDIISNNLSKVSEENSQFVNNITSNIKEEVKVEKLKFEEIKNNENNKNDIIIDEDDEKFEKEILEEEINDEINTEINNNLLNNSEDNTEEDIDTEDNIENEKTWQCEQCTYLNKFGSRTCDLCFYRNPNLKKTNIFNIEKNIVKKRKKSDIIKKNDNKKLNKKINNLNNNKNNSSNSKQLNKNSSLYSSPTITSSSLTFTTSSNLSTPSTPPSPIISSQNESSILTISPPSLSSTLSSSTTTTTASTTSSISQIFSEIPPEISGHNIIWICSACTYYNKIKNKRCIVCNSFRSKQFIYETIRKGEVDKEEELKKKDEEERMFLMTKKKREYLNLFPKETSSSLMLTSPSYTSKISFSLSNLEKPIAGTPLDKKYSQYLLLPTDFKGKDNLIGKDYQIDPLSLPDPKNFQYLHSVKDENNQSSSNSSTSSNSIDLTSDNYMYQVLWKPLEIDYNFELDKRNNPNSLSHSSSISNSAESTISSSSSTSSSISSNSLELTTESLRNYLENFKQHEVFALFTLYKNNYDIIKSTEILKKEINHLNFQSFYPLDPSTSSFTSFPSYNSSSISNSSNISSTSNTKSYRYGELDFFNSKYSLDYFINNNLLQEFNTNLEKYGNDNWTIFSKNFSLNHPLLNSPALCQDFYYGIWSKKYNKKKLKKKKN